MSVITKGRIFSNGEQLTAEKLNVLVDGASFNSSTAVDNSTTRVNGSGAITVKPQGITSTELAPSERWQNAYPVGSIYMNASDSTDPSVLLGFGTWAAFGAGRVPVGIDPSDADFDTAEETGGAKTHTLTKQEIPPHTHSYVKTDSTSNANGYDTNTTAKAVTGSTETGGGNIGENSDGTGNASPHNNLQPYIVVYMWKRTA
jgi:hypothetical protein